MSKKYEIVCWKGIEPVELFVTERELVCSTCGYAIKVTNQDFFHFKQGFTSECLKLDRQVWDHLVIP